MRWVDVASYVGLDRRQKRLLRIFDRRGHAEDANAPSLTTALRQLRLHQLHAEGQDGLEKFCVRATGTADLAKAYGEEGVAKLLMLLVENLKAMPEGDTAQMAETIEQTMPEIETAVRRRA